MTDELDPDELERLPSLSEEALKRINGSSAAGQAAERLNRRVAKFRDEGQRELDRLRIAFPDPPKYDDLFTDEDAKIIGGIAAEQRAAKEAAIAREQRGLDLAAEMVELQRHVVAGQQDLATRQAKHAATQAADARKLFYLEVAVAVLGVLTLVAGVLALL